MTFFRPRAYIDYMAPKLSRGKVWFVYYYVRNPLTDRLVRFRIKLGRYKSLSERRRAAREIMDAYSEKLSLGWNPFIERTASKSYASLFDALDMFLKVKGRELEDNSMRSYRSLVKIFRSWLERQGFGDRSFAVSVTREVARDYMREVEQDERISPRTYNNYLRFYDTLFNWMQEKGFIADNPFDGIRPKPKRLTRKSRRILSEDELGCLLRFLAKNNRPYLAMVILCYCCLVRPKEIAMLRCRDIDLSKSIVHIRSEIAKNDHDSYRTIPDAALPFLQGLDLSNPELYLFGQHPGYDFMPGKKMICSRKIASFWNYVVRKECNFGMDLQFYSLKDSGVTNMIASGVPVSFVQQQADHSSLAMTAIYLGRDDSRARQELRGVDILK